MIRRKRRGKSTKQKIVDSAMKDAKVARKIANRESKARTKALDRKSKADFKQRTAERRISLAKESGKTRRFTTGAGAATASATSGLSSWNSIINQASGTMQTGTTSQTNEQQTPVGSSIR